MMMAMLHKTTSAPFIESRNHFGWAQAKGNLPITSTINSRNDPRNEKCSGKLRDLDKVHEQLLLFYYHGTSSHRLSHPRSGRNSRAVRGTTLLYFDQPGTYKQLLLPFPTDLSENPPSKPWRTADLGAVKQLIFGCAARSCSSDGRIPELGEPSFSQYLTLELMTSTSV